MSELPARTSGELEQEAYRRILDELQTVYDRMASYLDSVRQDCGSMAEALIAQRDAVRQLSAGLTDAAHDTQVGTRQCREALDCVDEKLTRTINRLAGGAGYGGV